MDDEWNPEYDAINALDMNYFKMKGNEYHQPKVDSG